MDNSVSFLPRYHRCATQTGCTLGPLQVEEHTLTLNEKSHFYPGQSLHIQDKCED